MVMSKVENITRMGAVHQALAYPCASRKERYKTLNTLKKSKLVTMSLWAVVLLWLVIIFALSAQPATQSNGFSEKVTETIIETIAWIAHVDMDAKIIHGLVTQFNHLVRKCAHGWIYFVLGVLVITTLTKTGIRGYKAYVLTMVLCVSYAVTDEIHQTFVPGRTGQISDVVIDTAGAVLGMGMFWVYRGGFSTDKE